MPSALEQPAVGPSITGDGHALLAYRPKNFSFRARDASGLYGKSAWIEIPRNDDEFGALLREVAVAPSGSSPPSLSWGWVFCRHWRSVPA